MQQAKKVPAHRALAAVIHVIQAVGIAGAVVLWKLSVSRAGVAHHLVQRTMQLERAFDPKPAITCVLVDVVVITALLVWRDRRRGVSVGRSCLLIGIGVAVIWFALAKTSLRAYYYLFLILLVIYLLQVIVCVLPVRDAPKHG